MDFTGKKVVLGDLEISPLGNHWVLTQAFRVIVGTTHRLVCPENMWTDGASIPRFFWRLIGHPMTSSFVKAAVIHDAGYMNKLEWSYQEDGEWVVESHTRKEVDELLLALLKDLKVAWWRRKLMYRAVRWFGGSHWTDR